MLNFFSGYAGSVNKMTKDETQSLLRQLHCANESGALGLEVTSIAPPANRTCLVEEAGEVEDLFVHWPAELGQVTDQGAAGNLESVQEVCNQAFDSSLDTEL